MSPNKTLNFEDRVVETLVQLKEILYGYNLGGTVENLDVAIESGALYGKGKRNELAMLNGAVFYALKFKGVKVQLVAPTRVKKFATGNGRAGKEDMLEVLPKATSALFQSKFKKYDDVVDAYHLAKYAFTTDEEA